MDKIEDHGSHTESDDSEADEQICRSPQKSPRKISSILKRKRRHSASDPGGSSSLVEEEEEDDDDDDEEQSEEQSEEQILETARTSRMPTDEDFTFKEPQLRKRQFTFHPFSQLRGGETAASPGSEMRSVTVTIPEQLAASYGLYLWPSSPVLAWYLWLHQEQFRQRTVLELGAGTALPGILLAKVRN